ncbi:hypothetical protein ACFRJ9_18425 [Paenarthrobacter sp. NPDC056912]
MVDLLHGSLRDDAGNVILAFQKVHVDLVRADYSEKVPHAHAVSSTRVA